ncbi:MAG: 3,8-cyclase, partial [Actinomycetota bacterium]|nr:3,8-cyclase [Actinomycetota bacterium]
MTSERVPLVDPFDRVVRDLRISVTDRCNFRCTYCMPEEGMDWLPRSEILTFEEIERVARLCVERWGFTGIRLTGGEPTVRAGLPTLVAKLAALGVDLALTTNGATLRLIADDLKAAGLGRINISCDSLRRDRFLALTHRDALAQVLDGIDAALEAGFSPVKVNAVLMRGVNDDEVVDFATFGREKGVVVRFIEFMPLDADGAWTGEQVVSAAEILAAIGAVYPLTAVPGRGSQPAERYAYADGRGEIGVVPSVTRSFCGSCDRVRLTAEGMFRNCLFATRETDLRVLLRGGASDDELAAAIEADV